VPSPTRCLTAGDALIFVRDRAVQPPADHPLIGLELEWLTYHESDPARRLTTAELAPVLAGVAAGAARVGSGVVAAANGTLPAGGRITIEPGGQVELSSAPQPSAAEAIDATRTDMEVLRGALREAGIRLQGSGLDQHRSPERVIDTARYRAMEAYFDAFGPEGRAMMCNSASLQVNVDVDGEPMDAWRAATLAAPLLAQFFNAPSPNRMDLWSRIDHTRAMPVEGFDLPSAWAAYALEARVMFVRVDIDECVPILDGLTFIRWLEHGHPIGWPTEADLAEHLTTLFPPVRPRGWFELRTIDALDDACWPRAVELAAALVLEGPDRKKLLETGEVPGWR
jgi:glutamate--cysteine ligase